MTEKAELHSTSITPRQRKKRNRQGGGCWLLQRTPTQRHGRGSKVFLLHMVKNDHHRYKISFDVY